MGFAHAGVRRDKRDDSGSIASMAADETIRVRDLSKQDRSVVAVAGVTFSVRCATTCALLGGNGAGKTTTRGMLLGS